MSATKTRTLWIGNEPNPDDRLKIDVSNEDSARIPRAGIDRLGEKVTVTDLRTGRRVTVSRARCGLGTCVCALELVRWGKRVRAPQSAEHDNES